MFDTPKLYDVGFHMGDGKIWWIARSVTAEVAEQAAWDARKPKGARTIVRPRRL